MKKLLMIAIIIVSYSLSLQQVSAKARKAHSEKHKNRHSTASKRHSGHRRYVKAKHHYHYLPVDSTNFQTENNIVEDPDTLGHIYFSKIFDMPVDSMADVRLYHLVENWIGTPYRLGGDSHWGIDCSKFAGKIYNEVYNIPLGLNCRAIFRQVQPLDKEDLKEGDLVFFKIHSRSISHMGIYLGNHKFVHSSTSKGVMISNLEDPYFSRYFYSGGRLNYLSTASKQNSGSSQN